jgi:dephospho-CoA kinase
VSIHVFGLTGGIGSGKSTVARRLRERGVPVIDADQLAREVVAPGSEGLAEIAAAFGPEVLTAEGALDRDAMAKLVFSDDDARRKLNAITHPRVGALSVARTAELEARGEPLACYEVPLLFEGRFAEAFRPVVVVTVSEEAQVTRTVARDRTTKEHARARMRAQMPLSEKARLADHVIDNSGDLDATYRRTDEVLDAICRDLGIDPARYPRP